MVKEPMNRSLYVFIATAAEEESRKEVAASKIPHSDNIFDRTGTYPGEAV